MTLNRLWLLSPVWVVGFTLVSRPAFVAQMPYGLDSIQYVLGVLNYDVRLHQPHPPGYFLFVMLGRLGTLLIRDANRSFVVLNVLFGAVCVWVVFQLGRELFDRNSALAGAVLLATSPTFWFHGEVALSNMLDCLLVTCLALLCWRTLQGQHRFSHLAALVLGFAGGVRQNSLPFLFPLFLFSIARTGMKRIVVSIAVLVSVVAAWYLPMVQMSGGLTAYQTALRDHWLNSNWHGLTLEWLPFNSICVGYFLLLGTGAGCLFLLLGLLFRLEADGWRALAGQRRAQFLVAWLVPPLSFFILVYSHPIQTGHSLIYLPALMILLPIAVRQTLSTLCRSWSQAAFERGVLFVMTCLVGCNLYVFLFMNTAVSRSAIRRYESEVQELTSQIRRSYRPEETILVSSDFMFNGYRELMFHLPEYHTYLAKSYLLEDRQQLFAGFQRQTQLVDAIRVSPGVKQFVLNADQFLLNPDLKLRKGLDQYPPENFVVTPSGFRLFHGSVQELPRMFPAIQVETQ
jgi:4-amino-4-deoxy-L-arabinose transferase-like glycosyltransferase